VSTNRVIAEIRSAATLSTSRPCGRQVV